MDQDGAPGVHPGLLPVRVCIMASVRRTSIDDQPAPEPVMTQPEIPRSEFENRTATIQHALPDRDFDVLLAYGDEHRKESL